MLSLSANALVTLGAIAQMTYPVRNSFRFFVISLVIALVLRRGGRRPIVQRPMSPARVR